MQEHSESSSSAPQSSAGSHQPLNAMVLLTEVPRLPLIQVQNFSINLPSLVIRQVRGELTSATCCWVTSCFHNGSWDYIACRLPPHVVPDSLAIYGLHSSHVSTCNILLRTTTRHPSFDDLSCVLLDLNLDVCETSSLQQFDPFILSRGP
jgi:hypothetical protein